MTDRVGDLCQVDSRELHTYPWNERHLNHLEFRKALFIRRGLDATYAADLACRMYERDVTRDDRRCCLECKNLQRGGTCFAATQGRKFSGSVVARNFSPVPDQLVRCEHFDWVTP